MTNPTFKTTMAKQRVILSLGVATPYRHLSAEERRQVSDVAQELNNRFILKQNKFDGMSAQGWTPLDSDPTAIRSPDGRIIRMRRPGE